MLRRRALPVLLAVLIAVPSLAVDLPKRRTGLWEMTTTAQGGQSAVGQLCIDEKTDDMARQLAQGALDCSKQDIRGDGDAWVIDSVCRFGESTATSRARVSGKFDSAYDIDVSAKYDPPLMGMRDSRASVQARWLGPCKPGQRPGDMTLPGGVTLNIFETAPGPPKR